MTTIKSKSKKQRLYYLHYSLRKKGYKVNTAAKTINVPSAEFQDNSYLPIIRKYFKELIAKGYGVQSSI